MKQLIIVILGTWTPILLGMIMPEWSAVFFQFFLMIALLAWQVESYKRDRRAD